LKPGRAKTPSGGLARESPSCRLACGRRACTGLSKVVVRNRAFVPV
jgi:hypothetical protein